MPNINNPETHLYKSHDHQTTKKSISNRIPNLIMAGRINIKKSFYFLPNLRVPRQQLKSPTLNNDMSSRRETAPRLPSPGTCQETTLAPMSVAHSRGGSRHPACGVSCWFRAEKSWVREQESWFRHVRKCQLLLSRSRASSEANVHVCVIPFATVRGMHCATSLVHHAV